VLAEDIRDRRAWKRKDLAPRDWLVPLPPRCLDELDAAARQVRSDPLPPLLLDPNQFALGACAEVMGRVREKLRGIGLAVLDRVPVERYAAEENRALAWLLGSLLGRLVAQKWDGTMIYDVRGMDLKGAGDVVKSEQTVGLSGRFGGQALAISFILTVSGTTLEASGFGADNTLYHLALQKR